jgi:hypothetical protein
MYPMKVIAEMTDNIVTKRKRTKGQITIYKTYTINKR